MLRILSLAIMIVVAVALGNLGAEDKHKMTKADVERQVKELSNWGRWGKDDQLGALNLITPEKRVQAAQLVKKGISVSLARDVEKDKALDNPSPFKHEMLLFGRGTDSQWASDNFSVDYHGFAHTHMDSLCHLFYEGKLYNGFTRERVGPKCSRSTTSRKASSREESCSTFRCCVACVFWNRVRRFTRKIWMHGWSMRR